MTLIETSLMHETRLILKNRIPENRLTRNRLIGKTPNFESRVLYESLPPPPESCLTYDDPYVRLDSHIVTRHDSF